MNGIKTFTNAGKEEVGNFVACQDNRKRPKYVFDAGGITAFFIANGRLNCKRCLKHRFIRVRCLHLICQLLLYSILSMSFGRSVG